MTELYNTGDRHRVLIVDEQPVTRLGIKTIIENTEDLEVCGEAESASQAIGLLGECMPEMIVADLSMSNGAGLSFIEQVTHYDEETRVLICSSKDELLYAERAFQAGARGCIDKDESPEEMLRAIRMLLEGKTYFSQDLMDRLLQKSPTMEEGIQESSIESLTNRELEVYGMIGHGMTTREIAESLHLSIKTIESHRYNIKQKLNLDNAQALLKSAVEWVMENQNENKAES